MSIVQIVTLDSTQLNIIKDSLKMVSKLLKDLLKDSWGSYTANCFYNYRKGITSL